MFVLYKKKCVVHVLYIVSCLLPSTEQLGLFKSDISSTRRPATRP